MANQRLNIDIVARDKTKQALNGVQKGLANVKGAVFNLRNAFLGLGAGLVARNLINTGKDIENLRVRLKFLLKDTNEGAKAFDNMSKFASKVPFSLEEISQGSGILATVTDNADDLQNMLEITGNVAATTGLDFRTAAEQIQRSFSAGIGAADLFREKGVRNMLGFKAGATVSIEETVEAFNKVFGRGGRFGKSTNELAKTFEGTLSMIGDKIFNFKKVLLEAGFFDELKRQFGDLDKFLEDNADKLDEIATSVGQNLAKAITGAVKIGKELIPVIKDIGGIMANMIRGFMELPTFVKEIGLVGALLFGKKGALALAGISFIIGRIKELSELPQIVPISEMDLKTVKDFDKAIESLQNKMIKPTTFIGEDGEKVYRDLTEAQKIHNDAIRDQLKILEDLRKIEAQRPEHQRILHDGLKIINEEHEKTTKELEKQKIKVKNIHEAHLSHKPFVEAQNKLHIQIHEKLKQQNDEFNLSSEILSTINSFTSRVSRSIAEAVVLGKSLNMSFKELGQQLLVDVLAKMMERIMLLTIEKLLLEKIFKQDTSKLAMEKSITKEKQKQVMLQAMLMAMGGGSGGGSMFNIGGSHAQGGAVSKGQPVLVGERGAEVFVPNSTGQIVQHARGQGSGGVNVNFTINTIDSRGFSDALQENRGTITGIINNALAEKGRSELV
jgi:hypothetical protein